MSKKGFSLIELILVIIVMGLACAGLATAIQQAIFYTNRTEVMATATALAAQEAERVNALVFASVVDENRGSPLSYTGNLASYSREIRVDSIDTAQPNLGSDPLMQNYKVVEVRVYHNAVVSAALEFLKTNH